MFLNSALNNIAFFFQIWNQSKLFSDWDIDLIRILFTLLIAPVNTDSKSLNDFENQSSASRWVKKGIRGHNMYDAEMSQK